METFTAQRMAQARRNGWLFLRSYTGTVLSVCDQVTDSDGVLPDNQILLPGSLVKAPDIFEFLLFDTTHL